MPERYDYEVLAHERTAEESTWAHIGWAHSIVEAGRLARDGLLDPAMDGVEIRDLRHEVVVPAAGCTRA